MKSTIGSHECLPTSDAMQQRGRYGLLPYIHLALLVDMHRTDSTVDRTSGLSAWTWKLFWHAQDASYLHKQVGGWEKNSSAFEIPFIWILTVFFLLQVLWLNYPSACVTFQLSRYMEEAALSDASLRYTFF